MTNANWFFAIIIVVIVALLGGWYLGSLDTTPSLTATTTPLGQAPTTTDTASTTAQITYSNADANTIAVTSPKQGATVSRTFTVSGQARGGWYFEANFPLEVLSNTGTRLVQSPVAAQGEWMTSNFVPFTVEVTIPGNYTGPATLVLHNDNPSGLPENAKSVSIPIIVQ